MTRFLLFLVLLAACVVLTFPHETVLQRFLVPRLESLGVSATFDEAGPALPLGVRARGVRLVRDGYGIDVDSLYLGATGSLDAEVCGGRVTGHISSASTFDVQLSDIDPSTCAAFRGLTLSGDFDGELTFDLPESAGVLRLHGKEGTFGGALPLSGSSASETPIGEWDFEEVLVEAKLEDDRLTLERAQAAAGGVTWVATRGTVERPLSPTPELDVEFRARAEQGSGSGRALVGLLPKATESAEGWRRYRVLGRADKLRLIGLK